MSDSERAMFQRDLYFLKDVKKKIYQPECQFRDVVDDQIEHLEWILKEQTPKD
ncbi:hypothetical protein JCM19037_4817 [Geomicrobium sp. JCM 19037]|uniref:hypothetical protein n=1 Tax=unclassified Geomicrobium TaxID=2628951 RepID=UPI00045F1998|nr:MULTISPECIES: hypothetical protein [unclassified Geomicrobium]GAK06237.1 hypothetical protein JCM19037_4817 [Geomicrobium sp. JCM 19037]GAK12142.1 hypothetical protein JCM19039_1882 [Geomicrobium sp. JCM 19039]